MITIYEKKIPFKGYAAFFTQLNRWHYWVLAEICSEPLLMKLHLWERKASWMTPSKMDNVRSYV
jgi:hypothetical protein